MPNSKLDLLIFTPTLDGGVGRVIHNLAEGLAQDGYNLEILTTQITGESFTSSKVKITNLNTGRTFKSLPQLVRILKDRQPRVFMSAIYHANLVSLLAHKLFRSKSRLILCEHIALAGVLAEQRPIMRRLFTVLINLFYKSADGVVTVSHDAINDLVSIGVPKDKIHVIYNPIISEDFFRLAEEQISFDRGTEPAILGVGRLTAQKDFATLIRAFRIVREKKNCKLWILGTGPESQPLVNLAKDLGVDADIKFFGFVKNPYPYIKQADLFVLSSRFEGLPTVLIEALALNKRIVSTDCHSGPREILQNGKLGALVPVGDEVNMAAAILVSLNSNQPQISNADYEPYTSALAVKDYEKVLFI